jgi:hypothetical protein
MYGQTSFADDSVPTRSQVPHLNRVLRAEVTEMARIDGEIMNAAPAGQVFDLAADDRDELRSNPRIVRAEQITGLRLVTAAS